MSDLPAIDGPVIQTASGRYVNPLDLQRDDVVIEDIAHALANQCRFSGHVHTFYSVAEHSVRVAEILEEAGHDVDVVLQGLMHDASEYVLIDVPRPLKSEALFGGAYLDAEAAASEIIFERFDIRVNADGSHDPAVKAADNVMLATERRDLMPRDGRTWVVLDGVPTRRAVIEPWSPKFARQAFLNCFWLLIERRELESAINEEVLA